MATYARSQPIGAPLVVPAAATRPLAAQPRMTLGRHYTLGLVALLAVLGFIAAMILNR